jgi:hypothetical protein
MLDTGYWILDLATGGFCCDLNFLSDVLNAPPPETGDWKLETQNPKP